MSGRKVAGRKVAGRRVADGRVAGGRVAGSNTQSCPERGRRDATRNPVLSEAEGTQHATRNTQHASRFLHQIDAGLILAALLTLFISQSLWQPGLPTAADTPIHLYRTMEYGRAWAPGMIVPRWAPNLAYGYGYPLFVFAPPLPYLLGLIFHTAGLTLEAALKTLMIVTILLYATGMYLLARDLLNSVEAGLVAGTAYAFAPFALREVLLYGGNVPQFLAIGLFPWCLWAMTRAARARAWGWAVLSAIFYAGVMLSHLFHAFVFTPVVGLYGVILLLGARATDEKISSTPVNRPSPLLLRLCPSGCASAPYHAWLAIPLGLLLSAFFWLPAFSERFYTRAQVDIYLEKSPFFVRYPHWTELAAWIQPLDARAANPYAPLTLGLVTLGLATLGLLGGIWLRASQSEPATGGQSVDRLPSTARVIFFFALVAASAVFLTLPASRPIWETITILQVAEFPWRMLGLANLGLAFLAGAALLLPPAKLRRPLTAVCLLLQLFGVAPYLYPVTAFSQYGRLTIADQIDYERRSQSVGTTTLSEYLPQTVSQPPTTSPLVETFQAGQIPERLDRSSLPTGATAELIEQTAVTHRYRLHSPRPFTLRLFQFDYPGWRARLDDHPTSLRPEAETGLILIDIPAGQHTLTVHFGETPDRIAAMVLTGLTIVGLAMAGVAHYRRSAVPKGHFISGQRPVSKKPGLPLKSVPTVISILLIIAGALWLKPVLRPVFTVKSPPGQVLPAQHQTEIEFEKGIRLIGYNLNKTVVPAGGYLQVVLYWQTDTAPIKANLQPFVHLDRLDDFSTVADATNYTPGDVTTESNLPTFHWDTVRYIRDEHDLILPPNTPPMAYAVRAGLIDPDQGRLLALADGSGDTAQLTIVNVAPPARQRPARLAQPLDTSFSHNHETIHLTGFELVSLTPERLDFKLAWQTDKPLQTDYTVFAQLLDLNQNLVTGFDRPPLDGAYPTSTWLPNQTIIDPRHVPLDQVQPGQYRLIVGLYHPITQQRLVTLDGADFVELTKVVIDKQ